MCRRPQQLCCCCWRGGLGSPSRVGPWRFRRGAFVNKTVPRHETHSPTVIGPTGPPSTSTSTRAASLWTDVWPMQPAVHRPQAAEDGGEAKPPEPPPSERKPIRPLLAAAAAAAHAACASVEALPACQQRRNPRLSPQFVPLPRPLTRVPCCRSLAFTGQRLGFCSISGTPARGRNASFSRLSPSGTHHAPPRQAEPRLCGQSASRKSAHDSDLKSLSKRSRSLAKELVSMERPSSEGA